MTLKHLDSLVFQFGLGLLLFGLGLEVLVLLISQSLCINNLLTDLSSTLISVTVVCVNNDVSVTRGKVRTVTGVVGSCRNCFVNRFIVQQPAKKID